MRINLKWINECFREVAPKKSDTSLLVYFIESSGKGCFIVNSMAEMSSVQPNISTQIRKHINGFFYAILEVLQRAADQKEVSIESVDTKAAAIVSIIISVNVLVRSKQNKKIIKEALDSIILIAKM